MMNTKQRLYHPIPCRTTALAFALLMLVVSCGGQDEPVAEMGDEIQLSDKEIMLGIDGWKPIAESRATIFENKEDFLKDERDSEKGGGSFTAYAYLRETGQVFIGGSRVWYVRNDINNHPLTGDWKFYNTKDNVYPSYYWPQNNTVDFFAYMPWHGSNRQKKNIEVGNYTVGKGLSLTCQINEPTSLADTDGQETIIAYTTNKSKADGTVNMHFVHPFATVSFDLEQAHRDLTINWIQFNDVYLTGRDTLNTTTPDAAGISWTPSGSMSNFKINVNKTVPEDLNFTSKIGGPYLVMPQDLDRGTPENTTDDITITINYTWDDDGNNNLESDDTMNLTSSIVVKDAVTKWLAGYHYKYKLDLGDNKTEILFKVEVEPWIPTGGNNNIFDVE